MLGPLLKVQIWYCVAGTRNSAPSQKGAKREGFPAFPKTKDDRGKFQQDLQRCISVAIVRVSKGFLRVSERLLKRCLKNVMWTGMRRLCHAAKAKVVHCADTHCSNEWVRVDEIVR